MLNLFSNCNITGRYLESSAVDIAIVATKTEKNKEKNPLNPDKAIIRY